MPDRVQPLLYQKRKLCEILVIKKLQLCLLQRMLHQLFDSHELRSLNIKDKNKYKFDPTLSYSWQEYWVRTCSSSIINSDKLQQNLNFKIDRESFLRVQLWIRPSFNRDSLSAFSVKSKNILSNRENPTPMRLYE